MPRTPADPLRVLVVTPYATLGGAETWLLQLLDTTPRIDAHVVLLQDGPLLGELKRRGIATAVHPVGRRPVDLLAPAGWLAGQIRRQRPDVVVGNGVKAQLVAAPAAWLAGAPVVWVKHDHSYDRVAPLLGRVSDAVVATVEEVGAPVGRDDVVVLPPPRPPVPPATREEARRFLADRGCPLGAAPVVVMATRLVPYKGVDDAIRALAESAGAAWELAVIGDDDAASPGEQRRLEELAGSLGVAERVRWLGRIPDAGHWLAAFDALAVLTKNVGPRDPGKEGFGLSALEAMLAGVPVIGVDGGAVTRRLAGVAGVAVPPGDPSAVAAALARLADPATRARAGSAARDLVADHPTVDVIADGFAQVLATAAARPGAGLGSPPAVSVVVPVYNEGEGVRRIVEQLVPQLAGDDEVVVVDDGSADDTAHWADVAAAAAGGPVRVVRRERNGGVGAARNTGVAAARHELVAFTDAGCNLEPTWLGAIRQAFAEDPRPDFVAGVYHASSGRILDTAMAVACYPDVDELRRPDWLVRLYGRVFGRVFSADRPAGRSLAFTKAAYDAVGGFREDMAATEDVDFSTAIARSGGRCVIAADADLEWVQAPVRGTARMYVKYGRGDARSHDRPVIVRDAARGAAYAVAPLALLAGRRGRAAVAVGAAAYLSLPLRRAARRPRAPLVMAAVPAMVALKDLAKLYGFVTELARDRTR